MQGQVKATGQTETRTLVVLQAEMPKDKAELESPAFQQKVRDWLDGKVPALVLGQHQSIHLVPVTVSV